MLTPFSIDKHILKIQNKIKQKISKKPQRQINKLKTPQTPPHLMTNADDIAQVTFCSLFSVFCQLDCAFFK